MSNFSLLTILLMLIGFLSHWIIVVNKAAELAAKDGQSAPTFWSYWTARPRTVVLSLMNLAAIYFILPEIAKRWPEFAVLLGATVDNPLNPLAALLAGYVAPSLSDIAGKRLAAIVNTTSPE